VDNVNGHPFGLRGHAFVVPIQMISYAQNFEDVMLNRVFRDRDNGFYIDVGAADPVVDSVTKFFYDEGWCGINIEPNEWFYNKLMADRPRDINLNVALGERDEERELYLFERIGNSTFEEASRDRYAERGFETRPVPVQVTTLAAICEQYATRPIDFLKIDCEGWEKFVIKGADWDRFRPSMLVIEATEPGTSAPSWQDWEPLLIEDASYDMVYFDGLNRFYLRRDLPDLRCHFEVPPNVHDDFRLYSAATAEQERDGLRGRIADLHERLNREIADNLQLKEKIQRGAGEMERLRSEIEHLSGELRSTKAQAAELDRKLVKTRLWVGQLSQDLAAARAR
jgi:FkbM family methyltransferase